MEIIGLTGLLSCILTMYLVSMATLFLSLVLMKKDEVRMERCIRQLKGYRSKRSMKNIDTWDFAQRYAIKCYMIVYTIEIFILIRIIILSYLTNVSIIDYLYFILITALIIIPLIIGRIFTEKALKENFNEDGTEKRNR